MMPWCRDALASNQADECFSFLAAVQCSPAVGCRAVTPPLARQNLDAPDDSRVLAHRNQMWG
eukprot:56709-Rhodomonas_salina.1